MVRQRASQGSVAAPEMAVPPQEAVIFYIDNWAYDALTGLAPLVSRLQSGGIRVALISGSAEPGRMRPGLAGMFEVISHPQADGRHPDMTDPAALLAVAVELGTEPGRSAVVSVDAVEPVVAARRGAFGRVVAIDRGEHREALEAAGADLVVGDLSQLDLGALRADPWTLVYEGFDAAHEGHREALTALGNGYLGTRGASPGERRGRGALSGHVSGRGLQPAHLGGARPHDGGRAPGQRAELATVGSAYDHQRMVVHRWP